MKWSVLLVVVGAAVYANSLGGPFFFDDLTSIVENPEIREPGGNAPQLWASTPVTGRPVVRLSFAANHALGGLDPRGYRVVNIAIHLLAGLVLFGLVRRTLMGSRLAKQFGSDADAIAWPWALAGVE